MDSAHGHGHRRARRDGARAHAEERRLQVHAEDGADEGSKAEDGAYRRRQQVDLQQDKADIAEGSKVGGGEGQKKKMGRGKVGNVRS
eukprot:4853165-Pleurochrysis_carterae.AAC.1